MRLARPDGRWCWRAPGLRLYALGHPEAAAGRAERRDVRAVRRVHRGRRAAPDRSRAAGEARRHGCGRVAPCVCAPRKSLRTNGCAWLRRRKLCAPAPCKTAARLGTILIYRKYTSCVPRREADAAAPARSERTERRCERHPQGPRLCDHQREIIDCTYAPATFLVESELMQAGGRKPHAHPRGAQQAGAGEPCAHPAQARRAGEARSRCARWTRCTRCAFWWSPYIVRTYAHLLAREALAAEREQVEKKCGAAYGPAAAPRGQRPAPDAAERGRQRLSARHDGQHLRPEQPHPRVLGPEGGLAAHRDLPRAHGDFGPAFGGRVTSGPPAR